MKYMIFILPVFFVIFCKQTELQNITAQDKSVESKVNSEKYSAENTDNLKYQDIKEVDFKNFTYLKINNQETNGKVRCLQGDFTVKNGLFEEKNSTRFNWASEIRFSIDEIFYGDLTNDGKDEAIIKSSCIFNLTDPKTEAYIFTLQNQEPQFVTFIEGGGATDGAIKSLKILPEGILEVVTIGSSTGRKTEIDRKFTDRYLLKDKKLVSTVKTKEENFKPE